MSSKASCPVGADLTPGTAMCAAASASWGLGSRAAPMGASELPAASPPGIPDGRWEAGTRPPPARAESGPQQAQLGPFRGGRMLRAGAVAGRGASVDGRPRAGGEAFWHFPAET